MRAHGMLEPAVKSAGRNALVPHVIGVDDCLHQPVKPFSSEPRDGNQRHAFELSKFFLGLLAQLANCSRRFILQIPFVDGNDDRPALLLDQVGNSLVLLFEGIINVEQHDHHLGKAHRIERVRD